MNINNNFSFGREEEFLEHLNQEFKKQPIKIDFIVSFIYGAGADLLIKMIKDNLKTTTKINILTSFYMNSTDVGGLNSLKTQLSALGYDINIKIYDTTENGFHPKAYIFTHKTHLAAFIGSSNVGYNAFRKNIEWNYKITKNELVSNMIKEFNYLWNLKTTENLTEERIQEERKKLHLRSYYREEFDGKGSLQVIKPNDLQQDILMELKKSRMLGEVKGLVVAATGIGKTYLAAFDSLNFSRVLFIAHRQDILQKTRESFETIRQDAMSNFYNNQKDSSGNVVFATIQTLTNNLHMFDEFDFDYIVIDEAHRSGAESYKKIIQHFSPAYLLGLTATPNRTDNANIYELFDENLIYEINLMEAISKGWLNNFEYYGIKDVKVDYDNIEYDSRTNLLNQKSLVKELNKVERHQFVYDHYKKYQNSRTAIGFCRNIKHANSIANFFKDRGVKVAVSTSNNIDNEIFLESSKAIDALKTSELQIVFTVDKFNEGIDIPNVDLILNTRPTESPIIFTQQIGRGLRKQEDKKRTVILDFVGNHKRLEIIPKLFFGINLREQGAKQAISSNFENNNFLENCLINFDFGVIDLFKQYNKSYYKEDFFQDVIMWNYQNSPRQKLIKNPYNHPTRYDSLLEIEYNTLTNAKKEFFRKHLHMLARKDMLHDDEKLLLDSNAMCILDAMSTNQYNKCYQGIMLKAFIKNEKELFNTIKIEQLIISFKKFYKSSNLKSEIEENKKKVSPSDINSMTDVKWKSIIEQGPLGGRYKFISYNKKTGEISLNIDKELLTNECFIFHYNDVVKCRLEMIYQSKNKEK